jgi:lysyl-tRNA synthetase class 2
MLDKVQADRQKKLEGIRELGIDPYGGRYDSAEPTGAVLAKFEDGKEGQTADAAGRLVLIRKMGKLMFAHIRDESGQMQIALQRDVLDETTWKLCKLLDLGDIVGVSGPLHRTQTGEITIWATKLTLLSKSLNPMPEKFHGLQDTETRYRQRYLDLMANPESMQQFKKRIAIIELFRKILNGRRYVEVETPVLQPIYGGAAARPFTTHHNALDALLYMRISPELYLKRLLVGGMERVYEFSRNFRNEGIDTRHNPEFTLLELYQAYADYHVMMEISEELIATAAEQIAGGQKLPYGEIEIDYTRPWRRAKYADLLKEHAGVEMTDIDAVKAKAKELRIETVGKDDAVIINQVFEETVEPHLVQPTFVIDYPADICPLTRRKSDDPTIAERFELFIANMEIGNAYTELNVSRQVTGEDKEETMRVMDEDFITALRHGMPPAGGLGIGIDRVIMLLTNTQSIRDVILFPMLRQHKQGEEAAPTGEETQE